jgi:hypothetical protein
MAMTKRPFGKDKAPRSSEGFISEALTGGHGPSEDIVDTKFDRPHQTIKSAYAIRHPAALEQALLHKHDAPATADGGVGEDVRKDFDIWAAGQALQVLESEYPGHLWRVVHDSKQGMAFISIPILMGVNNFMAVNLKTNLLDDHRVKLAGGEILERYGLLRGRFQLTPFLEAREKHSALVVPSRKVPG